MHFLYAAASFASVIKIEKKLARWRRLAESGISQSRTGEPRGRRKPNIPADSSRLAKQDFLTPGASDDALRSSAACK
jgi:hypothetical protein